MLLKSTTQDESKRRLPATHSDESVLAVALKLSHDSDSARLSSAESELVTCLSM